MIAPQDIRGIEIELKIMGSLRTCNISTIESAALSGSNLTLVKLIKYNAINPADKLIDKKEIQKKYVLKNDL
ncbi:hypothetical protein GCM10022421_32940 [Oceanisphaera sediminis]|uniref:Uncharacterized protein n=1 Tax=Oceanisphaera sediminis TaxID=981381 RepID=A0ABP7EPP7_9GAMM